MKQVEGNVMQRDAMATAISALGAKAEDDGFTTAKVLLESAGLPRMSVPFQRGVFDESGKCR